MNYAQSLGIRVVADLVVNHTSRQHPWFQEARRDRNSPRRPWYVWSHKRPSDAVDAQFPGESASLVRAGERRRRPAVWAIEQTTQVAVHASSFSSCAVPTSATWPAHRGATGLRFRGMRPRPRHAAARPWHPQTAGAQAERRQAAAGTRDEPLFSLPGMPLMQYGDEIGIWDGLSRTERECARMAMQCSNEEYGGNPNRCSTGWSAASAHERSLSRLPGARVRSSKRARPAFWWSAMTIAARRSSPFTISNQPSNRFTSTWATQWSCALRRVRRRSQPRRRGRPASHHDSTVRSYLVPCRRTRPAALSQRPHDTMSFCGLATLLQ